MEKVGHETEGRRAGDVKLDQALTEKCEIRSAVTDEFYEGFPHGLATSGMWCNDVGNREEREEHP